MGKRILLIQYVSAFLWDWVFLTLHVGEIPIYDLREDSQLVPAPHIATKKASIGMYVIITAILDCALFDTAIPTSSFNFCYCSFLIALWAINIFQYYHLAWFSIQCWTPLSLAKITFVIYSLSCTLLSITLSMNNTVYVSVECSVFRRTSKVQINNSIALGYDPLQWQHQKYGIVYT